MNLFEQDDTKNWKLATENAELSQSLLTNQTKAFQYMLPEESQILNSQKEELDFFAKQTHMEMRRTMMNNYQENKENFFEMGEMMSRSIYELNIGWSTFLQKYSPLNQQQIKLETDFVEDQAIGEELPQPPEVDEADQRRQSRNSLSGSIVSQREEQQIIEESKEES